MISRKTIQGFIAPIKWAGLFITSLSITACAVGPNYEGPPAMDVGKNWSQIVPATTTTVDLSHWWSQFTDPTLIRLVNTALENNLDIAIAMARIDEARALRDRVQGAQAPTVGANASINHRRQSENGPLPIGSMPGLDTTQTIYDLGFDAAWEIDLFGAQQRALESAQARLQAVEIQTQGVRMRIVAEVARAWFLISGTNQELRHQKNRVSNRQQALKIMQQRYDLGDVSAAEVDIAQLQWANAQALLPRLQARQHATILELGVLLGDLPEKEQALLSQTAPSLVLPTLPVGQRADILRRRPDVLAAERLLAASNADIGLATAELFPKLSIALGGGFQALSPNDWFDPTSSRFAIMPFISWRLFDGGRVRAEIRARQAIELQAALGYEQAVLTALADAERSLSDYHSGLAILQQQQTALDAALRHYQHTQSRYAAGDIALLELIAAEHQLYDSQHTTTQAHTAATIQLVALYKALGGGWDDAKPRQHAPDF